MSRVLLATVSVWRVPSILKLRRSGCVYVADQFVLYVGLSSAVWFVVVCLLLLRFTTKLPPNQGTPWVMFPLYVVCPATTAAPAALAPDRVLLDAFVVDDRVRFVPRTG